MFIGSTPVYEIVVLDATLGLGPFDSDQTLTINPARTLLLLDLLL